MNLRKASRARTTTLPDKTPVAPVNLFFHVSFPQVDVSLNERAIFSSNNTYPFRTYIATLISYGENAKQSSLSCEFFYKDECLETADPTQATNVNTVLEKNI